MLARRDQPNSPFGNPDNLKDKPIFSEDIPADKRLSRAKLISIADSYFSTIQQNSGKIYAPFASDCQRVENGMITANNPNGTGVAKQGCEEQLNKGLLSSSRVAAIGVSWSSTSRRVSCWSTASSIMPV